MDEKLEIKEWEIPKYSGTKIENAGKTLITSSISLYEANQALDILNNWRLSHAYPLQVIANELKHHIPNAIIAQRLKRLDSILGKLQRFPKMNLYKMQDLGGCRVIVNSIDELYTALYTYKNFNINHILKKENDYIQNPKVSGYRSYHMVYQFYNKDNETYNKNMFIEIQFRTHLQHIWATAVEMMGIYTKSNLKSSNGDEKILRFFTLVSSLFAIREHTPVCPNTSDWADELIKEIIAINEENNILMKLMAINEAVQITQYNENFHLIDGYYLLVLNYDEPSLNIYPYEQIKLPLAYKEYQKIEYDKQDSIDAVLVSTKSFDLLKTAYPNYFIDISEFMNLLTDIFETYNYILENDVIGVG